jgi:phage gpG-like protein
MLILRGTIHNVPQTHDALTRAIPILTDELSKAMRSSLFLVTRTAQKDYLSGPRPQRLGVVTNRLRGSLSEGASELVFRLDQQPTRLTGTVGTNVIYAPVHEYGAIITAVSAKYLTFRLRPDQRKPNDSGWRRRRQVSIPKRPFLNPALHDREPDIRERFKVALENVAVRLNQLLRGA